ncbi:MAG: hypothetical protein ABL973_21205 [Micropepsaceae bacterium]
MSKKVSTLRVHQRKKFGKLLAAENDLFRGKSGSQAFMGVRWKDCELLDCFLMTANHFDRPVQIKIAEVHLLASTH